MSIEALNAAKQIKVGNPVGKAILKTIAEYADEEGSCFPSQKRLASECECSERTVRDWLSRFEEKGLIRREDRRRENGSKTSSRMFLLFVQQPAAPAANPPSLPAAPSNLTGSSCRSIIVSGIVSNTIQQGDGKTEAGKPDWISMLQRLGEAAGIDETKHAGLTMPSIPLGWIAQGADLELDIIPALQSSADYIRDSGKQIRSWGWFTAKVMEAKERRLNPGSAKPSVSAAKRETAAEQVQRLMKKKESSQ